VEKEIGFSINAMKKQFSFSAKIWVWPGDTPWHFVNVPDDIKDIIIKYFPKSSLIKIIGSLETGKDMHIDWDTALFKNKNTKGEPCYIMPIKKDIRKKANISEGDILNIKIEIK
jgi:hypothetical protein